MVLHFQYLVATKPLGPQKCSLACTSFNDVSRSPAPFMFKCKLYIKYHFITAQARISLALTGRASEEIVSSAAERLRL